MTMTSIREELKQNKPFGRKAEEVVVSLLRTAELLRRHVDGVIEEAGGITGQQYNVLRILRGAGERGLPTLDIVDRLVEETPGITRLIDRLAGAINGDITQPGDASVEFTIKTASVDTGVANRDNRLRSADFFDAANNPEITFKSTSIKPTAKKNVFDVSGNLTMRGVTKP